MGNRASEAVMGIFDNLNNVRYVNTHFKFRLLDDPDDDKFVNCAVAGNANYIVSHDTDFRKLKQIDFAKVEDLNIE